jgi:ribonuclease HI
MKKDKIIIYCDGACAGNQFENNVGGWGAVLSFRDKRKEIYGGEKNTTNNRMELTACIRALEQIKSKDYEIEMYCDSAYIVNCINERWYVKWQRNGWKTAQKKPVESQELWKRLLESINRYNVSFHKVKGHAGVELNELADALANRGMAEAQMK